MNWKASFLFFPICSGNSPKPPTFVIPKILEIVDCIEEGVPLLKAMADFV